MLIGKTGAIPSSEITSESLYLRRRSFLKKGLLGAGGIAVSGLAGAAPLVLPAKPETTFRTDEALTPYKDVTSYNNFYEFGFDKSAPARYEGRLVTDPWSVEIAGHVRRPGRIQLEDLVHPHRLEERIYRFRCVEGWSMVIPWLGFGLADLLKRFEPTEDAKFVRFVTLQDATQFPNQRPSVASFPWPYEEGLRLDEAMNPLAFMAVGLYGKVLPTQNGAPIRLVVPWKYGFKSIKSVVRIELVSDMPPTTWNNLQPQEYGFYANVNPEVDHPRWSQATERRLPGTLFNPNRIATQKFNGYGEQVAHLYRGMDLTRNF